MSPHPKPPSIFLPHPIPLCCPRALTLSSLLHASNLNWSPIFSSVQFNHSVIYNSLRPHGLQHARVTCPSPTPGAYSNSCPSSLWCHSTNSSSVVPFSFCLQSFPASGSFPMSQHFASGGQSIGVSASVLSVNIQGWFPLGLPGLISLLSKESSPAPQFESINSLALSVLYGPILTSVHDYWKNYSFDYTTLLAKWCSCFLTWCLGLS